MTWQPTWASAPANVKRCSRTYLPSWARPHKPRPLPTQTDALCSALRRRPLLPPPPDSKPASVLRRSDRLQPIPCAQFADRIRQVIAYCRSGEIELSADRVTRHSGLGGAQHVRLPIGQRTGAGFNRYGDEFRVEHAPPDGDRSDRVRQGGRWSVLQEKPLYMRLERAQQVARLTEPGENQRPAGRQAPVERFGGAQAVDPRQIDVDHSDVGSCFLRDLDDAVTSIQLGDDVDVGFEPQQGHQSAADHVHVLRDQHLDHVASSGTSATRTKRPIPETCPCALPESSAARAARPLNPCPYGDIGPAPSFAISRRT